MSKAKLPASTDQCAKCGRPAENHLNYGVGTKLWCNNHGVMGHTDAFDVFTPKPLQVEGPTSNHTHAFTTYADGTEISCIVCGLSQEEWRRQKAGAEATTKPDYLNKTLRECSREELMEALRVTEEKNKEIDAKSCISPEALDVRAGAEATVQGTTRIDAENMAREATGKSDREIIEKLAEEGGQSKWPEKAAAREAVEQYKERLKERVNARYRNELQYYQSLMERHAARVENEWFLKLIDELSNKKA